MMARQTGVQRGEAWQEGISSGIVTAAMYVVCGETSGGDRERTIKQAVSSDNGAI